MQSRKNPIEYFKWLVGQLRGWNIQSYILLFFGMGFNLALTLTGQLNWITILTFIAGALGLTCTLAINNCKAVNGWLGLISAIMLIVIAFTSKNYMDIAMQSSYVLLLDLPVIFMPSWNKNQENKITGLKEQGKNKLSTTLLTIKNWIPYIVGLVVVVIVMYFAMIKLTDDPRPFIDSLSASVGIIGAILTTLKKREAYVFWFIQAIMSILLWGVTAMQGDGSLVLFVTYFLYLANDVIAFTKSPWFHKKNLKGGVNIE